MTAAARERWGIHCCGVCLRDRDDSELVVMPLAGGQSRGGEIRPDRCWYRCRAGACDAEYRRLYPRSATWIP